MRSITWYISPGHGAREPVIQRGLQVESEENRNTAEHETE